MTRSRNSRRGSHQPHDDHERQEMEHDRRRQERSAFMEATAEAHRCEGDCPSCGWITARATCPMCGADVEAA